jgi:hypothetical protein
MKTKLTPDEKRLRQLAGRKRMQERREKFPGIRLRLKGDAQAEIYIESGDDQYLYLWWPTSVGQHGAKLDLIDDLWRLQRLIHALVARYNGAIESLNEQTKKTRMKEAECFTP